MHSELNGTVEEELWVNHPCSYESEKTTTVSEKGVAFISTTYTENSNTMNITHLVDLSPRSFQLLCQDWSLATLRLESWSSLLRFTQVSLHSLNVSSQYWKQRCKKQF